MTSHSQHPGRNGAPRSEVEPPDVRPLGAEDKGPASAPADPFAKDPEAEEHLNKSIEYYRSVSPDKLPQETEFALLEYGKESHYRFGDYDE